MTPTSTDCIPEQFKFEVEKSRPVVVNFKGGTVTSDAGLSLIAELDRKRQITSRLAACFKDYRESNRTTAFYRELNCTKNLRSNHGI